MTLFDHMDKRPGTVIVVFAVLSGLAYGAFFLGALLLVKAIFFGGE